MKKLNILLLGYIIRGPIGGMTWHHLNYFLGLNKLGHNVFFIEDSGDYEECCYNPKLNVTAKESEYGLVYANEVFSHVGFPDKWCYYNKHRNQWEGPQANNVNRIISESDILINVSLVNPIRSWLEKIPVRIAIDTDPVFTQIKNINDNLHFELTKEHTHFFTFGENFGQHDCSIPNDTFKWRPTCQPIFLPEWNEKPVKTEGKWTTIMLWESYKTQMLEGKHYGMKSLSFEPFKSFPSMVEKETMELAMGNTGPVEELQSKGWHILNPLIPSINPWTYREYIEHSKGEWSIAKHGYVATNSGWFSERSACYLASGKPVITQETGFSKLIPTGDGLFSFKNPFEAANHIQEVASDYTYHCKSAREIAEEYFNSDKVLSQLLNQI